MTAPPLITRLRDICRLRGALPGQRDPAVRQAVALGDERLRQLARRAERLRAVGVDGLPKGSNGGTWGVRRGWGGNKGRIGVGGSERMRSGKGEEMHGHCTGLQHSNMFPTFHASYPHTWVPVDERSDIIQRFNGSPSRGLCRGGGGRGGRGLHREQGRPGGLPPGVSPPAAGAPGGPGGRRRDSGAAIDPALQNRGGVPAPWCARLFLDRGDLLV